MPYELTIHRVGALANVRRDRPSDVGYEGRDLVASFREHANEIPQRGAFERAERVILDAAQSVDPHARYVPEGIAPGDEIEPIEIFTMPKNSPFVPPDIRNVKDHLVGLLPSKKMDCSLGDGENRMAWILRIRASVTACALERNCHFPKLWWTFEGIPADDDPLRRPTETQAAQFITFANGMAGKALDELHIAYREALIRVTKEARTDLELRPERIRISLTDNEDRPLAEVIDAMTVERLPFSEIASSEGPRNRWAREGTDEFKAFVNDVIGHVPMTDKTVSIFSEVPALKGLICEYKNPPSGEFLFAGLARSSSMRGGYSAVSLEQKRVEKREGHLRAASAARPLSAMLASREAINLDNQLAFR